MRDAISKHGQVDADYDILEERGRNLILAGDVARFERSAPCINNAARCFTALCALELGMCFVQGRACEVVAYFSKSESKSESKWLCLSALTITKLSFVWHGCARWRKRTVWRDAALGTRNVLRTGTGVCGGRVFLKVRAKVRVKVALTLGSDYN